MVVRVRVRVKAVMAVIRAVERRRIGFLLRGGGGGRDMLLLIG